VAHFEHRFADCAGELTGHLQTIASRRAAGRPYLPLRYASRLVDLVRLSRTSGLTAKDRARLDLNIGDFLRHSHDFYGWKAKDTANRRGVCSGALYRSGRYLALDPAARSGAKASQNVHIEHTVQIRVLRESLKASWELLQTPAEVHTHVMRYSVCTAVHICEKDPLGDEWNPAFDSAGRVKLRTPFARYRPLAAVDPDFRVFNVVTRKEVCLDTFTFDDHLAMLEASSCLAFAGREDHPRPYALD
jgi:hypothetical protein